MKLISGKNKNIYFFIYNWGNQINDGFGCKVCQFSQFDCNITIICGGILFEEDSVIMLNFTRKGWIIELSNCFSHFNFCNVFNGVYYIRLFQRWETFIHILCVNVQWNWIQSASITRLSFIRKYSTGAEPVRYRILFVHWISTYNL